MGQAAWCASVSASVLALQALTSSYVVPAGTVLHVRLTSAVSSRAARPGDPVSATLVAPVMVGTRILLADAHLSGQIAEATAHAPERQASLRLSFQQLEVDGTVTAVVTQVLTVDNARETVDDQGTIRGPRTKADGSWGRVELLGLAVLVPELFAIDVVGSRVHEGVRVDVAYAPGVDLDLEVTAPFTLNAAALRDVPVVPALPAPLTELVAALPIRTAAGQPPRPADLTNLVFVGAEDVLRGAFVRAGWSTADRVSARADVKAFLAIAAREGYQHGPVSLQTLDRRPPDLVFQKQNNTFAKRHHVRIWRRGSWDGRPVWVAAATHDIGVKFDVRGRSFTHRVERRVDLERDKIVTDLGFAGVAPAVYVERPTAPRAVLNATQDEMVTDGRVAVIRMPDSN